MMRSCSSFLHLCVPSSPWAMRSLFDNFLSLRQWAGSGQDVGFFYESICKGRSNNGPARRSRALRSGA